jgi:hypothetical protein
MQKQEEGWQELVRQARERVKADLSGRDRPPPEDVLEQLRDECLEQLSTEYLPDSTAWLFPEYDFDAMDLKEHSGVIIERLLERGTWPQIRWLFATYSEARVAGWVRRHGFRLLSKRSFALWRLVLGIDDYVAPEWAVKARSMEAW